MANGGILSCIVEIHYQGKRRGQRSSRLREKSTQKRLMEIFLLSALCYRASYTAAQIVSSNMDIRSGFSFGQ
jgi:hypothetical protein